MLRFLDVAFFDGYININDNSIGIEIANLGYIEGNDPRIEDMKKAIWYINREIERRKNGRINPRSTRKGKN